MNTKSAWVVRGLALAAALACNSLPAYSKTYSCVVQGAYQVEKGALERHPLANHYVGERFEIDSETGRMTGDGFASTQWMGRKEILDPGSSEQSFKLLFVTPPFVSVRLVTVNEYDPGPMKNFLIMENNSTFTGMCNSPN